MHMIKVWKIKTFWTLSFSHICHTNYFCFVLLLPHYCHVSLLHTAFSLASEWNPSHRYEAEPPQKIRFLIKTPSKTLARLLPSPSPPPPPIQSPIAWTRRKSAMGKAKGSQRLDKYYRFAKETGYRSRASFKLLQLDARYKFLSSARAVLDLCAAPGGWMQVAVQKGPVASLVLGVDLAPIRPMQGGVSLIADITTTKCRAAVKKVLDQHGVPAFDVILHDGSPNVGGAWAQEATTQSVLVIESVKMATEFLAPRGTFVTKVFFSFFFLFVIVIVEDTNAALLNWFVNVDM